MILGEKSDKCHDVDINPEFIETGRDHDSSENTGEEFWHSRLPSSRNSSNFSVLRCHLGMCLNAGSMQPVWGGGPRLCVSNELPGVSDAAVQGLRADRAGEGLVTAQLVLMLFLKKRC